MSNDTPKTTVIRSFNINEYARVKLSTACLKLWRENAQRLREAFPGQAHLWPADPLTDDAGFCRAQLWSIINLIGPECVAGGHATEDGHLHLEFKE